MLNVLHASPYPTTFWRKYYHSDVADDEIKVLERLGMSSKPTQSGVQVLIQEVWHRSLWLTQVSEFCGPGTWHFFRFWVTVPFWPLSVLVFSILGSPGTGCPFPSLHHTHPNSTPLSPGLAWGSFCFLPPTWLTSEVAWRGPDRRAPACDPSRWFFPLPLAAPQGKRKVLNLINHICKITSGFWDKDVVRNRHFTCYTTGWAVKLIISPIGKYWIKLISILQLPLTSDCLMN